MAKIIDLDKHMPSGYLSHLRKNLTDEQVMEEIRQVGVDFLRSQNDSNVKLRDYKDAVEIEKVAHEFDCNIYEACSRFYGDTFQWDFRGKDHPSLRD